MINTFFPELPPSSNKIYYNRPGGGRGITAAATSYKNRLVHALTQYILDEGVRFERHFPYQLELIFHISKEKMYNKTWPKCKYLFAKFDVDNMVKLVVDAISKATAIDDRHNVSINISKESIPMRCQTEEGVSIYYQTVGGWNGGATKNT